mmetsp:Transcript_37259/g.57155  ORF Transcript_37259/g.57155 Transcript_37259/m.57155 type:complete len:219 (-) Transcript_37259:487-1143(-)
MEQSLDLDHGTGRSGEALRSSVVHQESTRSHADAGSEATSEHIERVTDGHLLLEEEVDFQETHQEVVVNSEIQSGVFVDQGIVLRDRYRHRNQQGRGQSEADSQDSGTFVASFLNFGRRSSVLREGHEQHATNHEADAHEVASLELLVEQEVEDDGSVDTVSGAESSDEALVEASLLSEHESEHSRDLEADIHNAPQHQAGNVGPVDGEISALSILSH